MRIRFIKVAYEFRMLHIFQSPSNILWNWTSWVDIWRIHSKASRVTALREVATSLKVKTTQNRWLNASLLRLESLIIEVTGKVLKRDRNYMLRIATLSRIILHSSQKNYRWFQETLIQTVWTVVKLDARNCTSLRQAKRVLTIVARRSYPIWRRNTIITSSDIKACL